MKNFQNLGKNQDIKIKGAIKAPPVNKGITAIANKKAPIIIKTIPIQNNEELHGAGTALDAPQSIIPIIKMIIEPSSPTGDVTIKYICKHILLKICGERTAFIQI